ncbi:uncharacterized protein LOC143025378 [Oratosquilla oratoria]|uniref:uncharacterized protein LOC143025378 n=1 Tax=Oratosquilla oratoria TaxID=337810 RepID=UPI003F77718A
MPRLLDNSTALTLYGCTSEDLSAKATRSGRISYKPLEYWNFEQLDQTKDRTGHVKVVRKKTELHNGRSSVLFPRDISVICREPLTQEQIQGTLRTSTWIHSPVKRNYNRSIYESNRSFVTKSGRLSNKPVKYAEESVEKESKKPKKKLWTKGKAKNKEDTFVEPRLNLTQVTKSGRRSFMPVRYETIPSEGVNKRNRVVKKFVEQTEGVLSHLFERSPRVYLKRLSPDLDVFTEKNHKEDDKPNDVSVPEKKRQGRKKKIVSTLEIHKEDEAVVSDKPEDGPTQKKDGDLDELTEKTNKEDDKPKDVSVPEKKRRGRKKRNLDVFTEKTHKEDDKPKDVSVPEKKRRGRKKKNVSTLGTHKEDEAVVGGKPEDGPTQKKDGGDAVKPISNKSSGKVYNFELAELTWSDEEDIYKEAGVPAFPSPKKRKCHVSVIEKKDSSAQLTRSGRVSYKPLEYWNFEKVSYEETEEDQVKVIRKKSKLKGRNEVLRVNNQAVHEKAPGAQLEGKHSPESKKKEEESTIENNDSLYKEDEKIVKKFNDLKFYKVEGDKDLVVYVAQSLCMPEERFETGFIFLQKGDFVWGVPVGYMKVQVLKGNGVFIMENAQETPKDLAEGSLFHVEAGQKFTVRNNFGAKSPVLKMFILKYY